MASEPRAPPPIPVVEVLAAEAPIAPVEAFPVEGSSVGGCLVELPSNWAGYPPLLTGWVETPPVLGTCV